MDVKIRRSSIFLLLLVSCVLASMAVASNWPQLESRLEAWDGAKEVQLPTGIDPIEDPVFAPVVEMLLRAGFAVRTDGDSAAGDGLIMAQRQSGDEVRIVLTRARDGALLAVESVRRPAATLPRAHVLSTAIVTGKGRLVERNQVDAPVQHLRIESSSTANTMGVRSETGHLLGGDVLVDIPGQPRSIAAWPLISSTADADGTGFHLFALYDKELVHFHYYFKRRSNARSPHLERIATFRPATRVSRALRITCVDLDGDNRPELAPVWVEDIHSVDAGTDSRLHSWVLGVSPDGSMQERSADLKGYLAEDNGKLHLQQRGEYTTFEAAVYAISGAGGDPKRHYIRSAEPMAETGHWVLNHSRWPDSGRILIWNDDERLVLGAYPGKAAADNYAGGTLLSDFGSYQGATIYIPLQEPEYRGGFSIHDRIKERKEHVPRRMLPHAGSIFTTVRGRDAGLPLVGRASGRDKLVQIVEVEMGLQARSPFAAVDAFILDFALWQSADGVLQSVLLLNEKQDGSGRAYLQLQGAQY
ncbi:MAG: hypothetical protein RBR43_00900 [Desulfuromonadaceae bacterium]|nr:hypothetical protein [Desulfuromonas sp.]MDY0184420.1 hypothetical protein [Desulfuromonadaceae bacterium]